MPERLGPVPAPSAATQIVAVDAIPGTSAAAQPAEGTAPESGRSKRRKLSCPRSSKCYLSGVRGHKSNTCLIDSAELPILMDLEEEDLLASP